MNLSLFLAHFLDASATYVSIDRPFGLDIPVGYGEKHVLPGFLISAFHTAAIMFVLKLIIVSLVVYLIDIEFKSDLGSNPRLVGLIKLCILILGLGPGTRDLLRLMLGV
jgi:uncharacterized membrane protein